MREKTQLQTELFREGDTTDINNYRHFPLHISDFLKIKKKNIPIFDFSSPLKRKRNGIKALLILY